MPDIKNLTEEEKLAEIERQKQLASDNPTGFKVIVKEFKHDKVAMTALVILVLVWLSIFIGSLFIDTKEAMVVNILKTWRKPGQDGFFLGTDMGGRSIAKQLILGGRNSVVIGILVTLLTSGIGLLVGLFIGYYGGWVDNLGMRIIDFIQILPTLMLIIVIVTIVPNYTMWTFIFVMGIFYWPGMARLVRSKALSEARRDYVNASKTMGTSDFKIMFTGILPNISSILIVDGTLSFAANIGIETGLSYLGFGLPQNTPSLGTLIGYARRPEVISDKIYVWIPASLMILVMMLCINYIGQALRRASDAKQRVA
ncbi:MAG: ABC transporter permease [Tissierellia bacterium]|nr:ABC transporter permease [Tissierellia bacterium]